MSKWCFLKKSAERYKEAKGKTRLGLDSLNYLRDLLSLEPDQGKNEGMES